MKPALELVIAAVTLAPISPSRTVLFSAFGGLGQKSGSAADPERWVLAPNDMGTAASVRRRPAAVSVDERACQVRRPLVARTTFIDTSDVFRKGSQK